MSKNQFLKITITMLLVSTLGCVPSAASPCGNGTYAETGTRDDLQQYCAYPQAVVVVSGFSCPEGLPFFVELPNGSRVCSNRTLDRTTTFPSALCPVVGCSSDGGMQDGSVCLGIAAPTCVQGCGDSVLTPDCTESGWRCPEGTTRRPPGSDCACSGSGATARLVCNTCSSLVPRPVSQNITFRFSSGESGTLIIDPTTAERCDGFTLLRDPTGLARPLSFTLPDPALCEGPGPQAGEWDLRLVGREPVDIVWPAVELLTCTAWEQCEGDRIGSGTFGRSSGLIPGAYRATFYIRNSSCAGPRCSAIDPSGLCEQGDGSISVDFVLPESGDIVVEVPLMGSDS